MRISSNEQIYELRKKIFESADIAVMNLRETMEQVSPMELLFLMKFDKTGVDPVDGTKINLIEQLNQLFSDLVALEAVNDLLKRYPGKEFEMHLGTEAGFDIESTDGTVVCECFAVTTAGSNGKLKKDAEKLLFKALTKKKYIYFYSQNDKDETVDRLYGRFPEITFRRISKFLDTK